VHAYAWPGNVRELAASRRGLKAVSGQRRGQAVKAIQISRPVFHEPLAKNDARFLLILPSISEALSFDTSPEAPAAVALLLVRKAWRTRRTAGPPERPCRSYSVTSVGTVVS
jgi:hypothetical protein